MRLVISASNCGVSFGAPSLACHAIFLPRSGYTTSPKVRCATDRSHRTQGTYFIFLSNEESPTLARRRD